jgi:hypothetical protein
VIIKNDIYEKITSEGFRRNIFLPSSGWKNEGESKQCDAETKLFVNIAARATNLSELFLVVPFLDLFLD